MPEDLLLGLQIAASVAESLASVEGLVREALRRAAQVSLAVQGLRGSASTFENA